MNIDIQYKIKNNKNYLKFLRENSNWYKYLNRDPNNFKFFEEEVKTVYKLRPADKISRAVNTIEMLQTLFTNVK